jgi:predicted MFS family arabinose efflux permease
MSLVDNIRQENRAILVIASVQFVNIVDFMMVMPLGPDFLSALDVPVSKIGVLAAAYTLAASISGLLGSLFLDRLPRRKALIAAILGLAGGTVAAAFAWDFYSLLMARVLAGLFGGPMTSVGLAIIGDLVPHQRRGAALSKVMLGFSVASIFGVPLGLEIARVGGWRAPFIMVGLMALVIAIIARCLLPSLSHEDHLEASIKRLRVPFKILLTQKAVWSSYLLLICVMMSGFLIFPNIAAYVQFNLGFPREQLGQLYFVGGVSSLLVMTFCGRLVDLFGSVPWFVFGSLGFFAGLWFGMYLQPPMITPYWIFVSFMVFGAFRNISMQTLSSKVPQRSERAGFMSLQSAVQHSAMAMGSFLSSWLLGTSSEGHLVGVEFLALVSGSFVIIAVGLILILASQVRHREN